MTPSAAEQNGAQHGGTKIPFVNQSAEITAGQIPLQNAQILWGTVVPECEIEKNERKMRTFAFWGSCCSPVGGFIWFPQKQDLVPPEQDLVPSEQDSVPP